VGKSAILVKLVDLPELQRLDQTALLQWNPFDSFPGQAERGWGWDKIVVDNSNNTHKQHVKLKRRSARTPTPKDHAPKRQSHLRPIWRRVNSNQQLLRVPHIEPK
jgi:hypothetical protein